VWKAKGTAAFSSSKADEDVSTGCSSGEGGKVVDAVEFPATLALSWPAASSLSESRKRKVGHICVLGQPRRLSVEYMAAVWRQAMESVASMVPRPSYVVSECGK
jgi:hypothetical protein